jgi:hypothetical protein
MSFHHQASLPTGWSIPDQAILPGGREIAGTAARVYNLLVETARRSHRWKVGRHLAPAGWVPTWVLREPWSGGAAGDRRMRDLREAGVPIERDIFSIAEEAPGSSSWLWRIGKEGAGPSPKVVEADHPLIKVRFVESSAGAVDISPGSRHVLAPSLRCAGDEMYRDELLAAWRTGKLLPALQGRSEWALWADPTAAFNQVPVLKAALPKLGVTVGG